ncbi:MAG: GAF domain-containing protein [Bacteroidetes bacterium]|nr:GAF domain-containing protein [Bacteroidota bacterium]
MSLSGKFKKRVFIFLLVPVLSAVQFFTDDFILNLIAAALLIIYVAFIIFLRDSVRTDFEFQPDIPPVQEPLTEFDDQTPRSARPKFDTDAGEEFKIISGNKDIEVITGDNYIPTGPRLNRGGIFKPADLKENFVKIAKEKLPEDVSQDEEFGFVLEKIIAVIKEVFMAHTVVFFWFNKKKNRLTLEKFLSGSSDITKQKFDIENDVLSKIVKTEEPEILTDITSAAEHDVIRYYSTPQGIRSFVGVPLFYGNTLAGVLALDSKVGDAFGIETVYSLGRFVRVISIIISLFDEKFAETLSEQRLKALLGVLSADKKFVKESELHGAIENAVKSLVQWDAFTFVFYNPTEHKFKTSKIVNNTSLKYVGENLEIELTGTLVGKSIISGMPVKIDDTSSSDYVRFAKAEDVSFDGSFLAIPLVYDDQNYGVLCFESLKKSLYNNSDVQFLKSATKIFAFIVYSYSNQSLLKSLLSVDIETKTLNHESFVERLTSDLVKGSELSVPGAVALIQIDNFIEQKTLFEGDPFPKVLKTITQLIKEEMSPLTLLGRLNEKTFSVYFFNSTTKDIFLWAEKLRIKIARKPIAVVTKQTTFTVSIGVASTANKTDANEVLHNAELALNKALEKGGNTVKSI